MKESIKTALTIIAVFAIPVLFSVKGCKETSSKRQSEYANPFREGVKYLSKDGRTYEYNVYGEDDDGNYVVGNITIDNENNCGEGYVETDDGSEERVEVHWIDWGVMEGTDEYGTTYHLRVEGGAISSPNVDGSVKRSNETKILSFDAANYGHDLSGLPLVARCLNPVCAWGDSIPQRRYYVGGEDAAGHMAIGSICFYYDDIIGQGYIDVFDGNSTKSNVMVGAEWVNDSVMRAEDWDGVKYTLNVLHE